MSAVQRDLFVRGNGTGSVGWTLEPTRAAGDLAEAVFLGGVSRTAAGVLPVAGKTYLFVVTSDAISVLRAYQNQGGAMAIRNTSLAGTYTAPGAGDSTYIGAFFSTGANPATGVDVIGCASLDGTILTEAQIQEWYNACVGSTAMVSAPAGGTTHLWDSRDGGGATWAARVGGVDMTRTGTLSTTSFVPSWG